jgi:hypothetical protein
VLPQSATLVNTSCVSWDSWSWNACQQFRETLREVSCSWILHTMKVYSSNQNWNYYHNPFIGLLPYLFSHLGLNHTYLSLSCDGFLHLLVIFCLHFVALGFSALFNFTLFFLFFTSKGYLHIHNNTYKSISPFSFFSFFFFGKRR